MELDDLYSEAMRRLPRSYVYWLAGRPCDAKVDEALRATPQDRRPEGYDWGVPGWDLSRDRIIVRVKAGSRPVPEFTAAAHREQVAALGAWIDKAQGHALARWAGVVPETDLWR